MSGVLSGPDSGEISRGGSQEKNMYNVILIWIIVLLALVFILSLFSTFCFFFLQVHYLLSFLLSSDSTSIFIRCMQSFWCFIISEATERQLYMDADIWNFLRGTLVKIWWKNSIRSHLVSIVHALSRPPSFLLSFLPLSSLHLFSPSLCPHFHPLVFLFLLFIISCGIFFSHTASEPTDHFICSQPL